MSGKNLIYTTRAALLRAEQWFVYLSRPPVVWQTQKFALELSMKATKSFRTGLLSLKDLLTKVA